MLRRLFKFRYIIWFYKRKSIIIIKAVFISLFYTVLTVTEADNCNVVAVALKAAFIYFCYFLSIFFTCSKCNNLLADIIYALFKIFEFFKSPIASSVFLEKLISSCNFVLSIK